MILKRKKNNSILANLNQRIPTGAGLNKQGFTIVANQKQTFTKQGRQRVASMPVLWAKEWGAVKRFLELLESIDTSLKDLVEVEREKQEILVSQKG